MVEHELTGCWQKLMRADFHLKALDKAIERFRQPQTHELIARVDSQTAEHVFSVEWLDPPATWSAEIGNVLYNLHSALDHLAWQLATRKRYGVPPERGVRATFPIFKNRGDFWKKGRNGAWARTSGAHSLLQFPGDTRKMVLKLQPYAYGSRAPEHPLWLLYTLSNEDKHKTLHVVGTALLDSSLEVTQPKNVRVDELTSTRKRVGALTEIGRLKVVVTGRNANAKLKPQFTFGETFGDGTPLVAGEYIGAVLNRIAQYVFNDVFAEHFVPHFGASTWWFENLKALRENTADEYPM